LSTDDDVEKWIDAACNDGWDPSKGGWGPSEFDDAESGPPLSLADFEKARADLACGMRQSIFAAPFTACISAAALGSSEAHRGYAGDWVTRLIRRRGEPAF
jgi:hypothetical protein